MDLLRSGKFRGAFFWQIALFNTICLVVIFSLSLFAQDNLRIQRVYTKAGVPAQQKSKVSFRFTLADALPLLNSDDGGPIERIYGKSLSKFDKIVLKMEALRFVENLYNLTRAENFEPENVVYDSKKEKFVLVEFGSSPPELFDGLSDQPQPTLVDSWIKGGKISEATYVQFQKSIGVKRARADQNEHIAQVTDLCGKDLAGIPLVAPTRP